jgi:hypothetical protein
MEARHGERRPENRKPTSWTARILAPLALVLAAVAIVAVVGGSLDSSDDADNGGPERVSSSGCQPDEDVEDDVETGYYVIEAGDDLGAVADRTCIPIERITRLNEGRIDPQLLPIGGCVNLIPEGCKALATQEG